MRYACCKYMLYENYNLETILAYSHVVVVCGNDLLICIHTQKYNVIAIGLETG